MDIRQVRRGYNQFTKRLFFVHLTKISGLDKLLTIIWFCEVQ